MCDPTVPARFGLIAIVVVLGCYGSQTESPDDGAPGDDALADAADDGMPLDGHDTCCGSEDAGADGRDDVSTADDDARDDGADDVPTCTLDSGSCINDPPDTAIGSPCFRTTDCGPRLHCWTEFFELFDGMEYTSWRGGYCADAGYHEAGCRWTDTEECPTGSTCVDLGQDPTTGVEWMDCLDACASVSPAEVPWSTHCDCRDGYQCDPDRNVCLPGCSNDRECCEIWNDGRGGPLDGIRQEAEVERLPPEECSNVCNPCTFQCDNLGCPGGDCRLGGPCEHDSDCPSWGTCSFVSFLGRDIDPGMCIQKHCNAVGRECPLGSGCAAVGGGLFMCFPTCRAGTQPGDPDFSCLDAGTVGVPDPEDDACYPIPPGFWSDSTTADGFCMVGIFPGGATPIGSACWDSADCVSPMGLGGCTSIADDVPYFCFVSCNERLARAGICGGSDAAGVAEGVCVGVSCHEACDAPGAPPGTNGCTLAAMACYDSVPGGTDRFVADGASMPPGFCYLRCRDDDWCTAAWGWGACDPVSGVCTP